MRKITPISTDGDGWKLHQAMCRLFVRAAQMARKRPSPIDIAIAPESISVLVAMEQYFTEEKDLKEVIERLDKTFEPFNRTKKPVTKKTKAKRKKK